MYIFFLIKEILSFLYLSDSMFNSLVFSFHTFRENVLSKCVINVTIVVHQLNYNRWSNKTLVFNVLKEKI